MKRSRWVVVVLALVAAGCHHSSTAPTVVAPPTITDSFRGTLPVGGSSFYSFVIGANGTLNVTLNSLLVDGAPFTSTIGLSVGNPGGTTCVALTSGDETPGPTPQATGTYGPGTFCVRIYDDGTLTAPVAFDISIAHP
jgi:hypothetical protein